MAQAGELPPFQLTGLAGAPSLASASLTGEPVVLQFWASWCNSCSGVAKDLEAVFSKLKSRPRLLSVSLDESKAAAEAGTPRQMRVAAAGQKFYFADARQFAAGLGDLPIPTVLVVDRKGQIVARIVGHWGEAQRQEVKARLEEIARD